MKIACLLIENLPVQAEIQRNPQIAERPIILSVSAGSYRTVFDASPSLPGVFPDMPLGKALSYSRNVVSLQADPFHYQEIFRCVLSSLERYGVDFEIEKLGQVYVRLDNAAASSERSSPRPTPNSWNPALAGLERGPSSLKIVGTASLRRTPATCFIAGWSCGAKQNPIPSSSRQRSTEETGASTFTPRADKTSAEPV